MMAPVLWIGGKGMFKKTILEHLPKSKVYVEPYGGAGSVLLNKSPAPVEVYNDLSGDLVNLFRVLQDPEKNKALRKKIYHTLYSRSEFCKAVEMRNETDEIEKAWSFYVGQNQGFGGRATSPGNWGRALYVSRRGMAGTVCKWETRKKLFKAWRVRMRRVQIDNQDALKVITYWDAPGVLFYLDPPYIHDTRTGKNDYEHEQTNEHHEALVGLLLGLQGAAVLSGYAHPIYQPLIDNGWVKKDFVTSAYSAGRGRGSSIRGGEAPKRTESIYISPRAWEWLEKEKGNQGELFHGI